MNPTALVLAAALALDGAAFTAAYCGSDAAHPEHVALASGAEIATFAPVAPLLEVSETTLHFEGQAVSDFDALRSTLRQAMEEAHAQASRFPQAKLSGVLSVAVDRRARAEVVLAVVDAARSARFTEVAWLAEAPAPVPAPLDPELAETVAAELHATTNPQGAMATWMSRAVGMPDEPRDLVPGAPLCVAAYEGFRSVASAPSAQKCTMLGPLVDRVAADCPERARAIVTILQVSGTSGAGLRATSTRLDPTAKQLLVPRATPFADLLPKLVGRRALNLQVR